MGKVSILIPAFNSERYIGQAIESALAQDVPEGLEVIVMDDGSTDQTLHQARRYAGRIRVETQPNQGANVARNRLMAMASGEWLQFLDADDYLLPDKIKTQLEVAAKEPGGVDVVYSPTTISYEPDGSLQPVPARMPVDVYEHYLQWTPFCTHGMILRHQAVREVGGWKEDQPVCQEHELLGRLIMAGKCFRWWNKSASIYRMHSTATISKKDPLRTVRTRMALTSNMERWLIEQQKLTVPHKKALYVSRMEAARSSWTHDHHLAREYAREAGKHGTFHVKGVPCLPARYQWMKRILGFERTESVAARLRG